MEQEGRATLKCPDKINRWIRSTSLKPNELSQQIREKVLPVKSRFET